METRRRSIAKALSWRVIATLLTATIAWLVTGHFRDALKIGGADLVLKLVVYYYHERAWQRIAYGRPPETPDYQI